MKNNSTVLCNNSENYYDPFFEYNAPKYYDFAAEQSVLELNRSAWFEKEHPNHECTNTDFTDSMSSDKENMDPYRHKAKMKSVISSKEKVVKALKKQKRESKDSLEACIFSSNSSLSEKKIRGNLSKVSSVCPKRTSSSLLFEEKISNIIGKGDLDKSCIVENPSYEEFNSSISYSTLSQSNSKVSQTANNTSDQLADRDKSSHHEESLFSSIEDLLWEEIDSEKIIVQSVEVVTSPQKF